MVPAVGICLWQIGCSCGLIQQLNGWLDIEKDVVTGGLWSGTRTALAQRWNVHSWISTPPLPPPWCVSGEYSNSMQSMQELLAPAQLVLHEVTRYFHIHHLPPPLCRANWEINGIYCRPIRRGRACGLTNEKAGSGGDFYYKIIHTIQSIFLQLKYAYISLYKFNHYSTTVSTSSTSVFWSFLEGHFYFRFLQLTRRQWPIGTTVYCIV
jgi:hypothetical protein